MSMIFQRFKNSLQKNKKGIIMMLFSSLCVCVAQLLWKLAWSDGTNIGYLVIGFVLYGVGAVIMVIAYRYGSLSVLQPMLAANNIFAPVLAVIVLPDEIISPRRIVGIAVIILGITLIGGGDD